MDCQVFVHNASYDPESRCECERFDEISYSEALSLPIMETKVFFHFKANSAGVNFTSAVPNLTLHPRLKTQRNDQPSKTNVYCRRFYVYGRHLFCTGQRWQWSFVQPQIFNHQIKFKYQADTRLLDACICLFYI
jgi:hypothetical protein